jgi:hypothetical protein
MGMFSMTSSFSPRPKLRVTRRSSIPFRPHEAQTSLDEIYVDDDERSRWPDFGEVLTFVAAVRDSSDKRLDFPRLATALALRDFAREDWRAQNFRSSPLAGRDRPRCVARPGPYSVTVVTITSSTGSTAASRTWEGRGAPGGSAIPVSRVFPHDR